LVGGESYGVEELEGAKTHLWVPEIWVGVAEKWVASEEVRAAVD
jgi:hypothetical protein